MPSAAAPVVVIAPDSFKGSLDAPGVCEALAIGLRRAWPHVDVIARPMADGGEGTLDAVLAAAAHGERRTRSVEAANGRAIEAEYGILHEAVGDAAVIEIAKVVGITDADAMRAPVSHRSTSGVGQLMRALLDDGIRRFKVGLGGSSTNDGGAGLLVALGLALLDDRGRRCDPTPAGLARLAAVDVQAFDRRVMDSTITIMSDVNNPLCGARGATAIFGPQKGVAPDDVERIDGAISRFAALAERAMARDVAHRAGAGAAGGLGFAFQLVGGRFASGAEVVADLIALDAALARADWAITGEGRTDSQTLLGKTPLVVATRARAVHVPVSLVSGAIDRAALPDLANVFAGAFALPAGPSTLERCVADAPSLLADRAEALARLVDGALRSGRFSAIAHAS